MAEIFVLRIELLNIEPLIWRRVHVSTEVSLARLHDVLQVVMGWTDSHLHSFSIGERRFTNAEDFEDLNMLSGMGHNLDGLLADRIREFEYEYDFGDGWEHRIIVEAGRRLAVPGMYCRRASLPAGRRGWPTGI